MRQSEEFGELTEEQEKVIDSIRPRKIVLPIVIGIAVIIYLLSRQLDIDELRAIRWTGYAMFWIGISVAVYMLRHLLNSWRLKVLSEGDFSWWKSIELVTILEFASAVSPTNFGGSAVAFFLLIQERISGARATAIVIYTIVADTVIFVITLPLLYFLFGDSIFVPAKEIHTVWGGLLVTLFIVWVIMTVYGTLLLYGLFIQPRHLKNLLLVFSKWRIFGGTRKKIKQAAFEIEESSIHIRSQPFFFHFKTSLATLVAWIFRFFSISAILIAVSPSMSQTLYDHFILLGRGEALYAVTAYSPTPGGSGVAEILFGQFYSEYISRGIAVVAAILWRLVTYYPYLFLGVIIIPNWILKILNRRRAEKVAH